MKTLIVAVILMAAGGKKEDVTGWFGGALLVGEFGIGDGDSHTCGGRGCLE